MIDKLSSSEISLKNYSAITNLIQFEITGSLESLPNLASINMDESIVGGFLFQYLPSSNGDKALFDCLDMNLLPKFNNIQSTTQLMNCAKDPKKKRPIVLLCTAYSTIAFVKLITSTSETGLDLSSSGNFDKLTTLDLSLSTNLATSAFDSAPFPASLTALTLPAAPTINFSFNGLKDNSTISISISSGTTTFSPTSIIDTQFNTLDFSSATTLTALNPPTTLTTFKPDHLDKTAITKLSFPSGKLTTFSPSTLPPTLETLDLSLS